MSETISLEGERARRRSEREAPLPQSEYDYGGAQAPPAPFADDAPQVGSSNPQAPIKFTPTPFTWRDPSAFPRRQFVYGRHYARQFLSVTAAQTKVGKSSLGLVEAVAMATGQNLLGIEAARPMRVWYWNGEDPQEELERRVLAICLHYHVDVQGVERNLFIDSGRDTEIIVATQTKEGSVIATPVEAALTAALINGKFDAFILDPAVSVHRVSENDNMMIDAVAKTFGRIAGRANVAIEAIHHTRKLGGAAATIEDSRGASAWISAARDVRVLNRMTKGESAKVGIEDGRERLYFRADADGNLAPSSATEWFHLASQGLGNGSGWQVDDQDYVGVVTPWRWQDAFEGVTVSDLRAVQSAVDRGSWRENVQAKDWVGIAIGQVLKLDPNNKSHRAKISALLKKWIANGMFVVVERLDDKREKRSFVEVGKPAND
jgi:AAA domain